MNNIRLFSRYTSPENFATNNTMLLLSRIYQIDSRFFQKLLNGLIDSGELSIGPSFGQQRSSGGSGIPDGMIIQQSFKVVIETKISDNQFWGKEEYVTHFNNEAIRVLITVSKFGINKARQEQFITRLGEYDSQQHAVGKTLYADLTFRKLIDDIRNLIIQTESRNRFDLEELLDDYEGYTIQSGLLNDTHERMHVFAINSSESDNIKYNLYYNQSNRNEREHKFIGLYRNKAIKYIAETKCIVIPKRNPDDSISYQVIKGELTSEMKTRLELFFNSEGWGDKGEVKFHMFEQMYPTNFRKTSSYGIMGPRNFNLTEHIPKFPKIYDAEWVANELNGKEWQ